MQLIATTKDGFLASVSVQEAIRLTGKSKPEIGDSAAVIETLNKAKWAIEQSSRLESLKTELDAASSRVASIIEQERERQEHERIEVRT